MVSSLVLAGLDWLGAKRVSGSDNRAAKWRACRSATGPRRVSKALSLSRRASGPSLRSTPQTRKKLVMKG